MPITITITAETGAEAADHMWHLLNAAAVQKTLAPRQPQTNINVSLGNGPMHFSENLKEYIPTPNVDAEKETPPNLSVESEAAEEAKPRAPRKPRAKSAESLAPEPATFEKPEPAKPADLSGGDLFDDEPEEFVAELVEQTPVELLEEVQKLAAKVADKFSPNAVIYMKHKHGFLKLSESSAEIQRKVRVDLAAFLAADSLPDDVQAFIEKQGA